jgi:hypothetical protein
VGDFDFRSATVRDRSGQDHGALHPLVLAGRIVGGLVLGIPSLVPAVILGTLGGSWTIDFGTLAGVVGFSATFTGIFLAGVAVGAVAGQIVALALLAIMRRVRS